MPFPKDTTSRAVECRQVSYTIDQRRSTPRFREQTTRDLQVVLCEGQRSRALLTLSNPKSEKALTMLFDGDMPTEAFLQRTNISVADLVGHEAFSLQRLAVMVATRLCMAIAPRTTITLKNDGEEGIEIALAVNVSPTDTRPDMRPWASVKYNPAALDKFIELQRPSILPPPSSPRTVRIAPSK